MSIESSNVEGGGVESAEASPQEKVLEASRKQYEKFEGAGPRVLRILDDLMQKHESDNAV